ncbi:MAG: ABC transporter permease [Mycoplasma sp.]|nr:ABC transporter permease [Mycoplasma sp.]
MKPLLRLLHSYYMKGFFGPFFVIVFPIILLFILGNAFEGQAILSPDPDGFMRNTVSGILITAVISNGLFNVPVMIVEFKKTTMIKRIGAAQISKRKFLTAVFTYQIFWSIFSVIWILFWAGIIICTKSAFSWNIIFSENTLLALPYLVLSLITAITMGLLIVSLVKTQQGVIGISNVLYLPISFLSGSFFPKEQIDSSTTLSAITWVLPTKYTVDPFAATFTNGWDGIKDLGWEAYGFPLISVGISILFLAFTIKKFKWGE